MQGAVGVFDKALPLIVETAPETRFADWFDNVDGTLAAHVEAQEYWAVEAPPIAAHLAVGFACHERPRRHGVDRQWQLAALPGPLPNFELALQVAWTPTAQRSRCMPMPHATARWRRSAC